MSQLQPGRKPPGTKLRGSVVNARSLTAPIAAAVMAGLLFTYAITSIRAAKRNARLHREADGGQVDMRKESLRQHGLADKVPGTTTYELFRDAARREKDSGVQQLEDAARQRTQIEAGLEGIKDKGRK